MRRQVARRSTHRRTPSDSEAGRLHPALRWNEGQSTGGRDASVEPRVAGSYHGDDDEPQRSWSGFCSGRSDSGGRRNPV